MAQLFLLTGKTPDEFYAKPYKVRQFMLGTLLAELEEREERKKNRTEQEARIGGR